MKKILQIILTTYLLSSCVHFQNKHTQAKIVPSSDEFVLGTEDIPLAQGMNRYSDYHIDYDSGKGSIISVRYESKHEKEDINLFYITNLPYLGWNIDQVGKDEINFSRDQQNLKIRFIDNNDNNLVEFTSSSSLE